MCAINHLFAFRSSWRINFSSPLSTEQSEIMTHDVTKTRKASERKRENAERRRKVKGISQGWAFALGTVWFDTCRQERGRGQALLRDKPHLARVHKLYSPLWLWVKHISLCTMHFCKTSALPEGTKQIHRACLTAFVRSKFHQIVITFCTANLE